MNELERKLSLILAVHDVAIDIRNEDRTESVWPDKSDIHKATRQRILALFKEVDRGSEASG